MSDLEIFLYNSDIRKKKEDLAKYNEETKIKGGFIIRDPFLYIDIRRDGICSIPENWIR